ncbi:MAG TPA: MmgE/PrpD family protein, partial [Burkholderiales bacterium]|nr:MmgE/PrpD family protein [Burkholderiales bacterium]
MASLSRQLAQWVVGLRYEDLPPAVVDRAKGVTLHTLASVLLGSQSAAGKQAVKLITDEEAGVRRGATVMVDGTRVTKGGAAFANSEMALAGGKFDTFRMLTHPNTSILPGAFVAAETAGVSGKEFITGVAAGYEVMERMAADFIPTVMSRGFHSGPVFGIFGPAVAAAKILRFTEDQVNSTIALCASLAGGNLEGIRSGGKALREGAAVRNAMLAVALAQQGHVGGETVLEGDAGFYHAYAGNNKGLLTYSFVGDTHASFDKITANLGKDWMFLETLYRIYFTAGYNIAHIDVTAALCAEHDIRYENVERVDAVVNWLETQYPSPAFPSHREDGPARPGSTAYYTAYGIVKRGYPVLRGQTIDPAQDPPEVLELMKRVTIIPSHTMTLFGPRFTIYTKDGKSYTRQSTGREFIWDY